MNQGASGVKEYIQGKKSKHCFVHVEKGSYFSGTGMAQFNIDYSESPVLKCMKITRLGTVYILLFGWACCKLNVDFWLLQLPPDSGSTSVLNDCMNRRVMMGIKVARFHSGALLLCCEAKSYSYRPWCNRRFVSSYTCMSHYRNIARTR